MTMTETGRAICVFHCDPWESWLQQMIAENERDWRIMQLERDVQWEIDNGIRDEETDIEYTPVELLAEVQR